MQLLDSLRIKIKPLGVRGNHQFFVILHDPYRDRIVFPGNCQGIAPFRLQAEYEEQERGDKEGMYPDHI